MSLPTELNDISDWTIAQLVRASADRKSPLRWPVLVTGSNASGPSGRVVVLRRFDPQTNRAVIFTDRRSRKVKELSDHPRAELVFFDPKRMLQIRLRGTVNLHLDGAERDSAFDRLPARSQADYSTIQAPGKPLTQTVSERDLDTSRDQFALIQIDALEYDILSLEREGHRRAKVSVSNQGLHASWLVP
ncbi:MAG: pyridoxamine 5'-phosphate oxidase family protein [Pseudomonadota bacterium]